MRILLTLALTVFLSLTAPWLTAGEPEIQIWDAVRNVLMDNNTIQELGLSVAGLPLNPAVRRFTIRNMAAAGPGTDLVLTGPIFFPTVNVYGWYRPHANRISATRTQSLSLNLYPLRPGPWQVGVSYETNDADENPTYFEVRGTATQPTGPALLVFTDGQVILDNAIRAQFEYPIETIAVGQVPQLPGERILTYTVENIGAATLILSRVFFSSLVNCQMRALDIYPISIAPTQTTTIRVAIGGAAVGECSGQIQVQSNDSQGRSSYDWRVTGAVGASPEIRIRQESARDVVDGESRIGPRLVNDAPWKAVTIPYLVENLGTANLVISEPTVTTADTVVTFAWEPAVGAYPLTLAPSASRILLVTFHPALAAPPGNYTFTFNVPSNDIDEGAYDWTITGEATVPRPDLSLRSLGNNRNVKSNGVDVFPDLPNNAATTLNYTITNIGDVDLNFTSVSVVATQACAAAMTVTPGAQAIARTTSIPFALNVTPDGTGLWKVTVEMRSDSPGEDPYQFVITSYSSRSSGGGRDCGFGSPAGLLLLLGGLTLLRRRRP